jgi:hypothetical protein
MKNHSFNQSVAGALLLTALLWLPGCATSGYRNGEQTSATLQSLASRIEIASRQMDIAVTELNNLVHNPQSDLRPQFERYAAAVNKLDSLSRSVHKADANLQTRGKIHFDGWDQELTTIQNEAIRAQAQTRRLETLSRFNNIRNSCLTVLTGYAPVQSDLRDMQRFLYSDLTTGGLAAIRDTATRVTEQATPVREGVRKLVDEMRSLGNALSPQNAASPSPGK